MTRWRCAPVVLVALTAAFAVRGSAQATAWTADVVPVDTLAVPAPFGPGEHLVYGVKLGIFNVGQGHLTVEGLDWVRGNRTYRFVMGMEGGKLGFRLDDRYTSWTDVHTFQSWRFVRLYRGSYSSQRHYEFYPERDLWDREDNDEFGPMPTDLPLDDIAFVYFLRTLPLRVGDHYSFDRYFKIEGNPVTVDVVRRDRRKTDAGTFNTIVVRPSFQSEGLFSEDGEAELHFTDDARRILVYMRVNLPRFPGGISLHLRSIQEGFPLNPASRATALSARANR